jgi:acyl-CoA thioester hydrolase
MGEHSAKTEKKSTMVVETHTTYNQEVKEGDLVDVFLSHFDHDNKRLHYKLEMYDKAKNTLSATTEILSLYIDLNVRKVTNFEEEKKILMHELINKHKSNFKTNELKFSSKLKK